MKKRILTLILALSLILSLGLPAAAADDLHSLVESSAKYMLKTVKNPVVNSIGGEWAVIGLARSGCKVPQEYWDSYYAAVEDELAACDGVLHEKKYTDYSRVILGLTAIGADPANVGGYNLLMRLADYDKVIWQGINGPVWALIALDSGGYDIPYDPNAATQATRQMYIDNILSRQMPDGGWSLTDSLASYGSDPDVTGMVLQALAGYQDQSAVKAATGKALQYLSAAQEADGGYASFGSATSETVVQVIVALCSLGIDLNDQRFVKDGNSLLDNLLSYRQSNGSFKHMSAGAGSNQMATEQGFYGLVAALRAETGQSRLYLMDDVTISPTPKAQGDFGLPGKHSDVQKVPVTVIGKTFADIQGHKNQLSIEAMASRGIIDGMGDGSFLPDNTMTRAQFAAIVVRTLGLTPKTTNAFTDVPASAWYAPYIGTASSYGLITGRSQGIFDPENTITRQEAAVLVSRAAKLCGMDTELSDAEILNTLAQFMDYVTIDSWAKEGMAFCYGQDILPQSDLNTNPKTHILRAEIAQMLYNLMDSAKLL